MKTLLVVAILVAAVAGQPLNKELITPLKGMMGMNPWVSWPYNYGGDLPNMVDYDVPSINDDSLNLHVLHYDEIMVHPLFHEYMDLPLFHQWWSHPMFKKYVCSHLFQKYWTIPAFQQYFVHPHLFYKYIYPIVNLFKYDTTLTWNKNMWPMGVYQPEQSTTTGIPTICYTHSMYCNAVLDKLHKHLMYTTKITNVMTPDIMDVNNVAPVEAYKYNPFVARMMWPNYFNKDMYPTIYNKEMYPSIYNKDLPIPTV